jgi:hypothetical protein
VRGVVESEEAVSLFSERKRDVIVNAFENDRAGV